MRKVILSRYIVPIVLFLNLLSCGGEREDDGIKPAIGGGRGSGGSSETCSATKRALAIALNPNFRGKIAELKGLGFADKDGICRLRSNFIGIEESDISILNFPGESEGEFDNIGFPDRKTSVDTSKDLVDLSSLTIAPEDAGPLDNRIYINMWLHQLTTYYHSYGTLQRAIAAGVSPNRIPLVQIDAHCDIFSNAYYDPTNRKICLGFSTSTSFDPGLDDRKFFQIMWASQDATIIAHEYGHVINNAQGSFSNAIPEEIALNEALADYWAYSQVDSQEVLGTRKVNRIGEFFFTGSFPQVIRNLSTPSKKYPQDLSGGWHEDGTIFAQALYQISEDNLGKDKTDQLVVNMLALLERGSTLGGAAEKLRTAAGAVAGGGIGLDRDAQDSIDGILKEQGLYDRAITLAAGDIFLDSSKPFYIIDDFSFSSASNSNNCDGKLQVGEQALIIPNLRLVEDAGPEDGLGSVEATLELGESTRGIFIPTGGASASFFRLEDKNFGETIEDHSHLNWSAASVAAAFYVVAKTTGEKELTLTVTPQETVSGTSEFSLDTSLIVGAAFPPIIAPPRICPFGRGGAGGKINPENWPYVPEPEPEPGEEAGDDNT